VKILLTGSNGMVGRNVLQHPTAKCHTVLSPSSSELDLRNYSIVERWIHANKPDAIAHAAGVVGGIQANIKEPLRFLVDNLDIGRNIVLAAKAAGIKQLINLGSSCMYPRNAPNPLVEDSILNGHLEPTNEGYALAKIVTSKLCRYTSMADSNLSYKTLIPCNIYGPFDNFQPERSHMVPAIIRKLHEAKIKNDEAVEIWGDGTARREFMYSGDLADCIWQAIDSYDKLPETMNVGIGSDLSVNEYYEFAADVIGYQGVFTHDLSKPVGMKQKLVDVSKSSAWGWKASTSLRDGLIKTYQHFLEKLKDE
jgi:GDP-L-fucose synthase